MASDWQQKLTVLAVPLAAEVDSFKHGTFGRRIHAWTWQAFPIGMGTSAVCVCLANLHDQWSWAHDIARVFYYLTISIFIINTLTLMSQIILYPKRSKRLIFDPVMGVFVPIFCLSFGTVVIGTCAFAVPDGVVSSEFAYRLYWLYVALAALITFGMTLIWFDEGHALAEFTPADAFLVYPLMLAGLIGGNVLNVMDNTDYKAIGVLFSAIFFQGLGFFMAMFFIALYIVRIYLNGLLSGALANAGFVVTGPPGFTAAALISLGKHASVILPAFNLINPIAGEVWYAVSLLDALMLFGLAVFFFIFAALPYWFKLKKDLHQILGCWALTFPNVGWISTVKLLGDDLKIPGFYVLHDILTIAMCITWVLLVGFTATAFWKREIFYEQDALPSKDTAGAADIKRAERRATMMAAMEPSVSAEPLTTSGTANGQSMKDLEARGGPGDINGTGLSKRTLVGTGSTSVVQVA